MPLQSSRFEPSALWRSISVENLQDRVISAHSLFALCKAAGPFPWLSVRSSKYCPDFTGQRNTGVQIVFLRGKFSGTRIKVDATHDGRRQCPWRRPAENAAQILCICIELM